MTATTPITHITVRSDGHFIRLPTLLGVAAGLGLGVAVGLGLGWVAILLFSPFKLNFVDRLPVHGSGRPSCTAFW